MIPMTRATGKGLGVTARFTFGSIIFPDSIGRPVFLIAMTITPSNGTAAPVGSAWLSWGGINNSFLPEALCETAPCEDEP
jgi:hypothetical protein